MIRKLRETFRPESSYRAFFATIVTFALAHGLYKGIIDNYLADEVRATISTGVSVNHFITILVALFGGWIWKVLGIETLFMLSAVLGLCNSAYAATIRTRSQTAN